jgi:hypothetical protein
MQTIGPLEIKEPSIRLETIGPLEIKEPSIETEIKETIIEENNDPFLCEVDIHLDDSEVPETFVLKERKEMYYKMYQEARQKAKVARDLALSAYLEAKRIKNTYMLDDIIDSSDSEESGEEESDVESDEEEDETENNDE